MFDAIGVVYFGGLLASLATIHPSDIATWALRAQAVAHGSLTLIVFGSILIGRPFTEPYAREQAPERVWKTAAFHDLNRRLSAVWGLAFLVGTISLIIAGSQDSRQFVLRLVVPFGALLLALMYSQKQASVSAKQRPPADAAAPTISNPCHAAEPGARHARPQPLTGAARLLVLPPSYRCTGVSGSWWS